MNECRVQRRLDQLFAVYLRHFDKITQEIGVLDFDLPDLGEIAIARLQTGNHTAAFVAQRARFIESCIVPAGDEVTSAAIERQVRRECRAKRFGDAAMDLSEGRAGAIEL